MSLYMFRVLLIAVLVIIIGYVIYCKFAFRYWKKRNIPELVKPWILFGSVLDIIYVFKNTGFCFKKHYEIGKARGYKHAGYFIGTKPAYVPFSLEYIKNMLQKDFNYFSERGIYYNERDDPISANLFTLGGEKWRILRTKLSPAYTSKKLKRLFNNVLECAFQMRDSVAHTYENKKCIDLKNVSECFTIDAIGSGAFGLECNSFKNPESEFRKEGIKTFILTPFRRIQIMSGFLFPKVSRWLGITTFDSSSNTFFINVVKDSLKHRVKHGVGKENFLELLFHLGDEDKGLNKKFLTVEELAAQMFIFFAAGFETSSTTLMFCLYELSINHTIQNKVREEIKQVLEKHDGNFSYEAVMDMKYLDQIVHETLRKYPPAPSIPRETSKDYTIPGTNCVIEKGVIVYIPVLALHHDPEYYPEPEKFDPERFSEENNKKRKPLTYIPFGEGPRICIGLRFGLLLVKLGLAALLKDYKFSLNKKTKLPLDFKVYSITLKTKDKIYLNIEKAA